MTAGDLVLPGFVLILLAAIGGAVAQAVKGTRWIRPAYAVLVSLIAATALAVLGTDDLVSRQFSLVLLVLVSLIGLGITGVGSMLAIRRGRQTD